MSDIICSRSYQSPNSFSSSHKRSDFSDSLTIMCLCCMNMSSLVNSHGRTAIETFFSLFVDCQIYQYCKLKFSSHAALAIGYI